MEGTPSNSVVIAKPQSRSKSTTSYWTYRHWNQALSWGVISAFLLFSLFPVYWIVMTAFRSEIDIFHKPVLLYPTRLSLENINYVLFGSTTNDPIIRFFFTSLIIALTSTVLATGVGVMCAYGLGRYRVGGEFLSTWILSQRFFPGIALIVPLFVLFKKLGLLDTYYGLILLYITFNVPLATWLMLGHIQGLPVDLEEAALVEGATYWQVFWKIVLPLVKPGLAITAMFTFILSWNEYLFAFQLAGNQVSTITVYIPRLRTAISLLYGHIAAASLLSVVPAVMFAWVLQRYLVHGITTGGVKDL